MFCSTFLKVEKVEKVEKVDKKIDYNFKNI
jgi:hypothetical protein